MAKHPSFPRRGGVYLVQFDPSVGHELKKRRPAAIVSNDHMNELAATVLVMPITAGHFEYYHWIPVSPSEGGLTKPSTIVTEQLRAIDKRRIQRRLGTLRLDTMAKIEDAIRDHCGLPEGRVLP